MSDTSDSATDRDDPLAWAREHTPVLRALGDEHEEGQPLAGTTVAVASHLEPTTGVLIETLHRAGARVVFCPSEPQSTHADVVEQLDAVDGIEAFAEAEMSDEAFADAQHALLEERPDILLGDGGDLLARAHESHPEAVDALRGATEQTTAGVDRIRAMVEEGVLEVPVYAVNDTPMKHWFDNVHGTGESALVNVEMTTNATIAGKTVVVVGYGYCGTGIARKARGLDAHTVVTEVDPRKAIQAHLDGHRVMSLAEAAEVGDVFVTSTGSRNVIRPEHVERMTSGATLANAGHYDVEIDVDGLADLAERTTAPREGVTRYHLPDGSHVNLLADGRLVNLTGPASEGHPAEVMDTTFSMIFVAGLDLQERAADLDPGLFPVPERLDRDVAARKAETLGITVDEPTETEEAYAHDWHRDVRG